MPSGMPSKTQRPSLRSTVHGSCAFTEVKLGLASEYVKYSFLTKIVSLFGKVLVGTLLVPFPTPSKNTPVVETVMAQVSGEAANQGSSLQTQRPSAWICKFTVFAVLEGTPQWDTSGVVTGKKNMAKPKGPKGF